MHFMNKLNFTPTINLSDFPALEIRSKRLQKLRFLSPFSQCAPTRKLHCDSQGEHLIVILFFGIVWNHHAICDNNSRTQRSARKKAFWMT